jgi:hypothetical protein
MVMSVMSCATCSNLSNIASAFLREFESHLPRSAEAVGAEIYPVDCTVPLPEGIRDRGKA